MYHFPAPESQCYLDFVAVVQKLDEVTQFYLVIPLVRAWSKLDLLYVNLFLLFLCGLLLLVLVKQEFSIIHYTADRRRCIRYDFNKIQLSFICLDLCFSNTNYSDLLSINANQPYFRSCNFLI